MAQPYDDARYIVWCEEMESLIGEFLDTEGNTPDDLRAFVENSIDNHTPEG